MQTISSFWLVACTMLLELFMLLFWYFSHRMRKMKGLPPGSMGWPVVGDTLEFMEPHSLTSCGRFMEKRCMRYGNIFKSCLFGHPTIVSADGELNKFILAKEDTFFQCSYPSPFVSILGKWSPLTVVGEAHKQMRSISVRFLNPRRLRGVVFQDIQRYAQLVLQSWKEGEVITAREEAKKFSFYTMAKQVVSFNPGEERTWEFMKDFDTFIEGMTTAPINLPGTRYNRAIQSRTRLVKKLKVEMFERRRQPKGVHNDYLEAVMTDGNLSTEQILDLTIGLLFGGHDTSTAALTLAINFLAHSPKSVETLRAEHRQIHALKREGEALSWDDYQKMIFTQYVIKETLRLGNVAQHVHRKAIQDIHFKDYRIPKGWMILPMFSAVHLDPVVYADPFKFNPWRWEDMRADTYFTPFGGGRRLCVGVEVVKLQLAIFLHYLALQYEWKLKELDPPLFTPFVHFKKGLPIVVRKLQR